MEHSFNLEVLRLSRSQMANLLDKFSSEQLLKIPEGFRNNLIWNIGHTIVTQHLLVYGLHKHQLKLSPDFVERFRKGSSPNGLDEIEFLPIIKQELNQGIEELVRDFFYLNWDQKPNYPTSFGISLTSIDDVTKFLAMHEGIHLGYCLALAKNL